MPELRSPAMQANELSAAMMPALSLKRPSAKALFAPVQAFLQAALGGRAVATTGGMPLPADIRPIMEDPAGYLEAFKRFSDCTSEYETINPKVAEVMAALASRRADGRIRVLDVGAGFGWLPTVPCFGEYVKSYTAVEPNEVMRAHIHKAAAAAGLEPEVTARVVTDFFTPATTVADLQTKYDAENADEDEEANKFDMVLFSHSLYYFAPAEAAKVVFHALSKLTKADGRVLVIHQAREVMPIVEAMAAHAATLAPSQGEEEEGDAALSALIDEVVLVDGRVRVRRGTADEAAVLSILTNFCLVGASASAVEAAHNVLRENYVVRVDGRVDGSECVLNTGVVVVFGHA